MKGLKGDYMIYVLVVCEESQTVCKAFRDRGYIAFSADILSPSGGLPEYHIKGDALPLLNGFCTFRTMDNKQHYIEKWDLIIAHPPCTYLTVTGNRWFNIDKYGEKAIERFSKREEAAKFFKAISNANCRFIAIENPVGYMNTHFRKPEQIIQPYMFGEPFEKKTCLWLKGLPPLEPTNKVKPEPRTYFKSGKSMPKWYADLWGKTPAERSKLRSKTFEGIAIAMAEQWGDYVENYCQLNNPML